MSPWVSVHVKEEKGITVTLDMLKSYLDVTSVLSTGKQLLHMEDPRDQISVMKRLSSCVMTALTVFKANILWKLRNTHLRGSTVGFCDIFPCFISELVSESLFAEPDHKRIMLQLVMNHASYGASINSTGVFSVCVYIYQMNKKWEYLVYFSLCN